MAFAGMKEAHSLMPQSNAQLIEQSTPVAFTIRRTVDFDLRWHKRIGTGHV